MLNKFKKILLILCCIPLLSAVKPANFAVSGIEGDVLLNVQRRLTELYQDKVIANEVPDTLKMQVTKAMQPFGFFKPSISIIAGKNNTHLRIHISPGVQMLITTLAVEVKGEGSNNPKIMLTTRSLPIKTGQALNNTQYEDAKDKLTTVAENQGYLHASFEKAEILIDLQQYTAKITLIFNTGPQYYFGQIQFDPTYISPELLQRYLPFKYGQSYSPDQLLKLNSNLAASGYFKTVNATPTISDEPHVPIDVHLKRSRRISYSIGAGYGTDTGPRGLAGIHVIPVNRSGHKFNAIAQGSWQENALQAQYIIPGHNPVIDNYSINGGITNLNYDVGKSNAFQLSLAQQHVLTNFRRILSINALSDRYNYFSQNRTTESLIYPKAVFSWSKTSDPLFSPSGYSITITGLVANKAVLSQINMAQATLDAKAAFTIDLIRTRLYLHTIQGATQINDVYQIPLSLAQLLGGAENMKGYTYSALGPGRIMNYGGVEIQKETFKKWYLVGFFDSGNVYNPYFSNFKFDAGVGLMWASPVGPIKVGLAQALNNNMNRLAGSSPRLVVSMGPDLS